MSFTVEPVSPRDLKDFIRFPVSLYKNDPFFVPPLVHERLNFFSDRNPLFAFTEVQYFVARDPRFHGNRGNVVGRVTAHVNRRHNEFTGERTGFFGFFECIENAEVASLLMAAAEAWLRERGMVTARGPFNFSTNEECGFLAEGFDRSPSIMMTYTRPYYLDMMEALGYRSARNLLAYETAYPEGIPPHLTRVADRIRERTGVSLRPLDTKNFDRDVAVAFGVYNAAWERNWGFVPMTEDEFRFQAKDLKSVIDPSIVLLAEKNGSAVGFSLALMDYNVVFKKMNGGFFPFGIFHFLLGRRSIHHVRVLALGVLPEYRGKGVDTLLYHDSIRNGIAIGIKTSEMSWVLEENDLMRRALERMGGVVTKVYRIYEKVL
jgi:GNAT superfamily N-acetyltransferase